MGGGVGEWGGGGGGHIHFLSNLGVGCVSLSCGEGGFGGRVVKSSQL